MESIAHIEQYMDGITREQFFSSAQLQDAVIRRLLVIGEASKNLPPELRARYAAIPWNSIAGMRNVLIHEYFGTDTDVVWVTATQDLPVFKQPIVKILSELENGE